MSIMNSFVNDTFERVASEAIRLARYNKKKTLSSREVQTAVRLMLPVDCRNTLSLKVQSCYKYTSSLTKWLSLTARCTRRRVQCKCTYQQTLSPSARQSVGVANATGIYVKAVFRRFSAWACNTKEQLCSIVYMLT